MDNKVQWIICHHSVTPKSIDNNKSELSFNNNHKARNFPKSKAGWYIGYHKIIFDNGEVRTYREDNEVGAHCKELSINFKSLGICLEGDFDKEEPSLAQKKALLQLITEYQEKYKIPDSNVRPHRFFATGSEKNDTPFITFTGKKPYKSCWGTKLPDDIISYLKQYSMPELNVPPTEGWRLMVRSFAKHKKLLGDVDAFVNGSYDPDKVLALIINATMKNEYDTFINT